MFEGNAETMQSSLLLLKQMDPRTLVFPGKLALFSFRYEYMSVILFWSCLHAGHEYTWANLQFAYAIEPENHHIKVKHNNMCNKPTIDFLVILLSRKSTRVFDN